MPLHYNTGAQVEDKPSGTSFAPLQPGNYKFIVQDVTERLHSTGNAYEKSGCEGLALKLGVVVDGRLVPCYSHLLYRDDLLWKIKQFMKSIGRDFANPGEASDLVGDSGEAAFGVSEWNGKEKFEVEKFLPGSKAANNGTAQSSIPMPQRPKTSPHNDDDIPF